MSQVNFKLLHIFIAVAENRSFRQAAELLNRSQSAVSMQIRQLEEQIGVALFHRTTRRVELTGEGAKLLGFARRALAEWRNGLIEIRDAVDTQRETLSFACIPTIAATVLPRVLREFQANYPRISISLRELAAEDLLDSIRRREVDFGIGVRSARTAEFNFVHLFDEPIYTISTKTFRFRRGMSADLVELCNYPLLLNSGSTALRNLLDQAFAAKGINMSIKFEVAHTHTLTAFAAAGLGVGILPRIALPVALGKNLQTLRIANPALTRTVSIVTLKGHSLSPAARALSETMQKVLKTRS